ncbi:MAG: VWA domain-containing protein [Bauldia litoralis]
MTGFVDFLSDFHFIRPVWLVAVPLVLLLWWRIRSRATARPVPPRGVAPHLAAALTVGEAGRRRLLPIDGVMAAVVFASLGAAGPAWTRVPSPFVSQTAPLAIALEVSESMMATDIQPTRLDRAKHKILDLVATRAGARTALIAYAGSAHSVAPLTEDPEVLKPFLEALSPEVMPSDGANATAALELARGALAGQEFQGAILFVLDGLDAVDLPAFDANAAEDGPVVVYLKVGGSSDLRGPSGSTVVEVTADGSDVAEIERRVASAWREALARDDRQQWADRGWIFAIPAALLALIWFRRGWTMRWSVAVAVLLVFAGDGARAEGLTDWFGGTVAGWFLTPDQQGQIAYNNNRFAEAADLFTDPTWQSYALYRAGKYPEAAETASRLDTADAAITEGMARLRNREYRAGVAAFEKALERDPDNTTAAHNLEVAQQIVTYIERVQEQSDTGEEAGIGADEVRFDNESGRGTETRITGDEATKEMQTVDEWMRSVDTNASVFLRTRFALEAARPTP